MGISIQNFIVDTVLDSDQHHDVAINLNNSKTPELSIFPDLEPLGDIVTEEVLNFQAADLKTSFLFLKHVETYTLTKDNQYLVKSKNIQPGLDVEALLYPFHTFS
ncbi:hypothetical protein DI383_03060 [Flavobacteriaceae bacterium LYZ1037]|nr:hypothetical protein DI383_03060 [Flavobacteriaceae bacterium LYZ1037]